MLLDEESSQVDEPLDEDDDPVLVLAVVSASDCIVPTRANTPTAAAGVTAAATAATRPVMTVPLPGDAVSRPTVGERPERSP
ncbi:hypothetical protein [Streptomyces sp. NPDC002088]|uniref:hypothetical protein n=1 Tax=Streptomyces sp. NPDC002088 TaxID=3154665 RepID=UPI00331F4606